MPAIEVTVAQLTPRSVLREFWSQKGRPLSRHASFCAHRWPQASRARKQAGYVVAVVVVVVVACLSWLVFLHADICRIAGFLGFDARSGFVPTALGQKAEARAATLLLGGMTYLWGSFLFFCRSIFLYSRAASHSSGDETNR